MKNLPDMIFLIGPGGVGKTTVGPPLAQKIGYEFIDLDDIFCSMIENIGTYIRSYGYEAYVRQNSKCFFQIIDRQSSKCVVSLSSGFLIMEVAPGVVSSNIRAVRSLGTAVLLTPNTKDADAVHVVVERQLARGFGLERDKEHRKFLERNQEYRKFADITISSHASPEVMADQIVNALIK